MANYIQDCLQVCANWGLIPTEFRQCMTWEEQVLWLTKFLKEQVIPAFNGMSDQVNNLQTWFDNLDVQEEINNKLDEMAESGELTDIIAQYLQLAGVLAYDTEADLAGAENVSNGSICRTLGKLTYGDGLGDFFKIREVTNEDTVDGVHLIAITGSNTLVAERIPNGYLGDLSNLTTNNKSTIVGAINELDDRKYYGLHYTPFDIYVDSVNGDDTNDGLSSEHPKQTINNAIETYGNNGVRPEFRIYVAPGSYTFDCFNMTGFSIHFGTYGDNGTRTITMNNPLTVNPDDVAIYCAHININGSSNKPFVFNYTNSNGMYFDNCNFVARYTTFNGLIRLYAGEADFSHCVVKSIMANGCNVIFQQSDIGFIALDSSKLQAWACTYLTYIDPSVIESRTDDYYIRMRNSDLYIFGTSYVSYQGLPTKTNMCYIDGSRITIGSALNAFGSDVIVPFSGSITVNDSVILATSYRWNMFKRHATTLAVSEGCITSSGLSLS